MAEANWENMVPNPNKTTVSDYIPSNAIVSKEDETPDIDLKGKVEIKRTPWHKRTIKSFRKNWPAMLFSVAIPEMGKILLTKTFDVIYSSVFNEPYYGGSAKGNGYFFKNQSSVFDYTDFWKGAGSTSGKPTDTSKNKLAYNEIAFTDRRDVVEIIGRMIDKASKQGKISVSELYTIMSKTLKRNGYPDSYISMLETDQYTNLNWGWYLDDLRRAQPGLIGNNMYYLDLPEERNI